MILQELLTELSQRDVKLWAEGDQLRIRAPKDALTSELRDVLAKRKAEILLLVRSNNLAVNANSMPITRVPRDQDLSVSYNQQRLWSLIQSNPDSSIYNLPVVFRLTGNLDIGTIEESIQKIVRRQELLRTNFSEVNGQPVQIISTDKTLDLNVVDMRQRPKADQEGDIQRLVAEEAKKPFDLAGESLIRLKLLHLDDQEYMFLFTMHHIISDGWSVGVFIRELSAHYKAISANTASAVPELPVQYADYAHWQRQWLQGDVLEFYLAYWQQQLKGSPPSLLLPTDRSHAQTYGGDCQTLLFPDNLTESLKKLSLQEEVTLFITLLAAFKALLFCYKKQEDMIMCSPVACRDRPETKGLIGYFNNIVVLRTDMSGNPSIRELLGRIRQVTSEAYEHQDLPFQKIAEFPNLIRTPLSRAMFVLQNTPNPPLELPGISVKPLKIHRGMADFDLSLSMEEREEKLTAELEYKTDLFNTNTIIDFLQNFLTLLENMVKNPELRLSDLTPLLKIEQTQHSVVRQDDEKVNGRKMSIDTSPSSGEEGSAAKEQCVSPRDQLDAQLKMIWETCIGVKPIGISDNFFELGGHSLLAVSLLAEIEKATGKKLPLATLFQAPTIELLANIIRGDAKPEPWSSLVPIQPNGSKRPFFCAHGAGGHVLNYYSLVRHLGPDQPFYGLQAIGSDNDQEINTEIEKMAAVYIKEIREFQPEGPYFLGGYCMGGMIAYEIAQQLHCQGQKVGFLALFNTLNFSKYPPPKSLPGKIIHTVKSLIDNFKCHRRNLALLDPKEKRIFLVERAKWGQRRFGARIVSGKAMSPFISLQKLHHQAVDSYMPQPYPGRFTLFETRKVNESDEAAHESWEGLAADGIQVREIPAYFRGMLVEPFVRHLAEQLKECLETAEQMI